MIKRKCDLIVEDGNLRNGKGNIKREHIIMGDEFKGKGKLFAKITIPKGNSIGMHDHTEDFELYYYLLYTSLLYLFIYSKFSAPYSIPVLSPIPS